jgi:exopolyphosphatase/guanosine-5'-triphosphate,3'-diphosphate pyrophosphatase
MIWDKIKSRLLGNAIVPRDRGFAVPVSRLPNSQEEQLEAVMRLAQSCSYEKEHTHQVTYLALRLFDELQSLHGLGARERHWLHCASLLHDIGRRVTPGRGHHKASLRLVLKSPLLPFDPTVRRIVGSVARYHTKAHPKKKHNHFEELKPVHRRVVVRLSAVLRLADALDRTHRTLVRQLWCEVTARRVIVWCVLRGDEDWHRLLQRRAHEKGKLLEKVFDRELVIECVPVKNI